jgi:hypothetical protein
MPSLLTELIRLLGEQDSPRDSMLVHITRQQALALKNRGGSGHRDPLTGLYHFDDGDGGDAGGDSGNDGGYGSDGSATNGQDSTDTSGADAAGNFDSPASSPSNDPSVTNQGPGGSYGGVVGQAADPSQAVTDANNNAIGFGGFYGEGGAGTLTPQQQLEALGQQPGQNIPGTPGYDPSLESTAGINGTGTGIVGNTGVGAGVTGYGGFTDSPNEFAQWQYENPALSSILGGTLTALNPALGAAYGIGSSLNRGNVTDAVLGATGYVSPSTAAELAAAYGLVTGNIGQLASSALPGALGLDNYSSLAYNASGLGRDVSNAINSEFSQLGGTGQSAYNSSDSGQFDTSSSGTSGALSTAGATVPGASTTSAGSSQTSPVGALDAAIPTGETGTPQNVWNQESLRTLDALGV